MAVAEINITIERGTDFDAKFKILQSDLRSYSFSQYYSGKSKIRKYPSSSQYHEFDVYISGETGEVTISMNKSTTELLSLGRNYYDITITGPTPNINGVGVTFTTTKVVEGFAIVSDTASR